MMSTVNPWSWGPAGELLQENPDLLLFNNSKEKQGAAQFYYHRKLFLYFKTPTNVRA